MLHFNPLSRRTYIVISTITLLFALFGYYFKMYLPRQEEKLTAQRVRALHQISLNFIEKHKVTVKNLDYNETSLTNRGYEKIELESYKSNFNEIIFKVLEGQDSEKNSSYKYQLDKYFTSLERPKSFDSYLIYRNDTLVYKPMAGQKLLVPTREAKEGGKLDFIKLNRKTFQHYQLDTNPKLSTGLNVKLAAIDYKLFATSFTTDDNTQWTIYGLVNKSTFEAAKKKLPTLSVVLLTLGILLVLFALPLLKLFFMSPLERLHTKDVVFTASSLVVCPALILIAILALNACFIQGSNNTDRQLKDLSASIESDLDCEVRKIHQVINSFDAYAAGGAITFEIDSDNIEKVNVVNEKEFKEEYVDRIKWYPALNKIYWIDTLAYDRYELTTEQNGKNGRSKQIDLSERAYFKEIENGRGWRLSSDNKSIFYIEPIYSWLTGDNVTIISRPSQVSKTKLFSDIAVIAAQTNLSSVSDLVLPPGYSYSVIDASGKVLFHSEEQKNLRENYLAECDYDRGLQAALISEVETHVNVQYFNRDQRLYVNPLGNIPWFLVTAYDKEYSHIPYQHTASLTLISIFLIGFFALIQASGFVLIQMKRYKLKRKVFYHRWLWPYRQHRSKYQLLTTINLLVLVILISLGIFYSGEEGNFLQLLSTFVYAVLFISSLGFIILRFKQGQPHQVRIFLLTLVLMLIIYGITSFLLSRPFWSIELLKPAIPVIVLSVLTLFYKERASANIQGKNKPILKTYTFMVASYLLVTSLLPSLILFNSIYQQEMLIWKRYGLYQTALSLEERNWKLKERHNHKPDTVYEVVERKGKVYSALAYDSCKCPQDSLKDFENSSYHKLLAEVRPYYNSLSAKTNNFVFASDKTPFNSADYRWNTQRCSHDSLRIAYQRYQYPNEPGPIELATTVPSFLNFDLRKVKLGHLWIFLLSALLLFAIYRVILFASRRIFGIDLIKYPKLIEVDDSYLSKEEVPTGFKNLFVVAPPFSGAHRLYTKNKSEVSDGDNELGFLYDLKPKVVDTTGVTEDTVESIMRKIRGSRSRCIVLENFSYNISDRTVSAAKITLIESLLRKNESLLRKRKKIVIVSKFSPTQIYDEYEKYIKLAENESDKHELKNQIMRWRYVLSGFLQVYYSSAVGGEDTKFSKRLEEDATREEFVKYELRVNRHYFKRLEGLIYEKTDDKDGENCVSIELVKSLKTNDENNVKFELAFREELLLKIQNMAQPYYFSLWNSCSREEKYLLYDLADDGLVNTKNLPSILHLMEKGLIYYDESLHVMNESFRNFVLSDNCKDEALEMEKELRKNGTWSIARTVILISVAGVLGFVLFAQESVIDQFIALLAGVGATLPYLLRLGGFFNSAGSSSASTS